jgi:transposase
LRKGGLQAPRCFGPRGRPTRGSPHCRKRPRLPKVLEEVVEAIEPIKRPLGKPGRPTRKRPAKRPAKLHADKGYDFPRCREALRKRGIKARIARRGLDSSEKLGRHRRWVVERTLAWLARYRTQTVGALRAAR